MPEPGVKHCSGCRIDRPVTAFSKRTAARDGLQSRCKSCVSEMNRDYYLRTPEKNPARTRSRNLARWSARLIVRAYKIANPCVDCGLRDRFVMEFDHINGDKRGDISTMATKGLGVETILAEIAKCELVCANCHRRRTARRAGWR